MMCSIVFVYFLVPETKGIPLESMDQLFDIKPVWRAHGQMVAQLREDEERFRHDVESAGINMGKVRDEQVEDTAA